MYVCARGIEDIYIPLVIYFENRIHIFYAIIRWRDIHIYVCDVF